LIFIGFKKIDEKSNQLSFINPKIWRPDWISWTSTLSWFISCKKMLLFSFFRNGLFFYIFDFFSITAGFALSKSHLSFWETWFWKTSFNPFYADDYNRTAHSWETAARSKRLRETNFYWWKYSFPMLFQFSCLMTSSYFPSYFDISRAIPIFNWIIKIILTLLDIFPNNNCNRTILFFHAEKAEISFSWMKLFPSLNILPSENDKICSDNN
jgi:hypothetical protein